MPFTFDPDLHLALRERVRYCHEMGIYDFYRRKPRISESTENYSATPEIVASSSSAFQLELREEMAARKPAVTSNVVEDNILEIISPKPEQGVADPVAALRLIREDLGDCTRC
jgi:hypothetical protein